MDYRVPIREAATLRERRDGTNQESRLLANGVAAVALHFVHYNFCRIHQTLRVTPAMEAGISSHVWSIGELVGLLDAAEKKAA